MYCAVVRQESALSRDSFDSLLFQRLAQNDTGGRGDEFYSVNSQNKFILCNFVLFSVYLLTTDEKSDRLLKSILIIITLFRTCAFWLYSIITKKCNFLYYRDLLEIDLAVCVV